MEAARKVASYRSVPYKALAVPFGEDPGDAVRADDFTRYGDVPECDETEMALRYDRDFLHLTIVCRERSGEIDCHHSEGEPEVWNGSDRLEIFFGAVEPVPWLLQLAVSANGRRFDSSGDYGSWQAEVSVEERRWTARLRIALRRLRIQGLGCGFNVARISHQDRRISVWSRMERLFHEFENYGEIFFCDYRTACLARLNLCEPSLADRAAFEEMVRRNSVPAERVVHGPWLSNPGRGSMTVGFGTAGYAGAFVDYRRKGAASWTRKPCQRRHGVLARDRRIHICHLDGLDPGAEYEYRAVTLQPVTLQEERTPEFRFRTNPGGKAPFSMVLLSDVHSDAAHVRRVMEREETRRADFLVNLGDYLSCTSGPDGYYDAFLDVQCESFARERPLVFVRGNHEQVGIFSDVFNDMMPHPSGRFYYSFLYSDVMFVVLDPGNDHDDDSSGIHRNHERNLRQRDWLRDLARTADFKDAAFRVCLVHFPPQDRDEYDSQAVIGVVGDVPFDLMLCGHEHRYFSIAPMSGICDCKRSGERKGNAGRYPYPIVANDTDTFLQLAYDGRSLRLAALTAAGEPIEQIRIP